MDKEGTKMESDTFYDIHMHAFNLSHPCLNAFIRRYKIDLIWRFAPLISIASFLIAIPIAILSLLGRIFGRKFRRRVTSPISTGTTRVKNLLSIMENNFLDYFLVIENCLREEEKDLGKGRLLQDDGITVGGKKYPRVVITPLIMDFGYKGYKDRSIHYKERSRKPIKEQTSDLLNAIKAYKDFKWKEDYKDVFPNLKPRDDKAETKRILEIYPFLGLNTRNNYKLKDIEDLLEKYFGNYQGSREQLHENMGKFDGDIDHVKSNVFAGVKLYPPLGFDPWPEEKKNKQEYERAPRWAVKYEPVDEKEQLELVKKLYEYCERKQIPITVHGSESGFVIVNSKKRLKELTSIAKWQTVLSNYPKLKLNIAHFPLNEKRKDRLNQITDLILNYPNVYSDISCRAFNEKYYRALRKFIDQHSEEEREKLKNRIMFGTDFPVDLPNIDSYNQYIGLLSDSASIAEYRNLLCSVNPERFLFK